MTNYVTYAGKVLLEVGFDQDTKERILFFLSKLYYKDTLEQLSINTNTQRIYIETCEQLDRQAVLEPWYYSSRHGYKWGNIPYPTIENVLSHHTELYPYDLEMFINGRMETFLDAALIVEHFCNNNQEYYCCRLNIFDIIFNYIEQDIGILLETIQQIKSECFDNFWSQHRSNQNFRLYLQEHVQITHKKREILEYLNLLYYNCGHLKSIRYKISEYKQQLIHNIY